MEQAEDYSEKNIKPVEFKATMSRDGLFQLEFNQKMIVPFDFSRRLLFEKQKMSFDSIDVKKGLIDINLGAASESHIEGLSLTVWDERNVNVQIDFKDPLAVDAG